MKNLIGEYSNDATTYRNRCAKTEDQKRKYEKYIDIISVLTGKAIDYAKTGILYPMPRIISKYGRPLPYFMKYASPYYERLKLSRSRSNLNKLCWEIEHWKKGVRFKRTDQDFDYTIMLNDEIPISDEVYQEMEQVYRSFCAEVKELSRELKHMNGEEEEAERKRAYALLYERYRNRCYTICGGDSSLVANTAVTLCHNHKTWNQRFKWVVGGAGIVKNIKQVDISLPKQDDFGDLEYLGKRYKMVEIKKEDVPSFDR